MLKATCHCGAIEIIVDKAPDTITQCNCSVCRRYAALWGYYTRKTAQVNFAPDAATAYRWNDKVIEFYHCNICGCLTHYEDVSKNPDDRIAVNFRMFSPEVYQTAGLRKFDGAATWEMLDE